MFFYIIFYLYRAYTPETRNTPLIPCVNAYKTEPITLNDKTQKPVYFSPMYKALDTNLPKHLMRFNNHHFGDDLPLFPSRNDVLKYVQNYAKPVEHLIRFNSEITAVTKTELGTWKVEYTDFTQNFPIGKNYSEEFDAIISSSGHYDLPFLPEVKGIEEWTKKYPGTIQHSKYFDDPKVYTGKTVLVVGNSASGLDISMQAAEYATKVYRSIASASRMPYADDPRIIDVPIISEYKPETKKIVLDNSKGNFDSKTIPEVLTGIDVVIYCTGYLYSFPYLKSYMDPKNPDSVVLPSGRRINRLYQQLFYIPDPSICFVNMTKFTVPFPLSELQGSVIARVYSGRLELPSKEEMLASEKETEISKDNVDSEFHSLPFPLDVEYYRFMENWVKTKTKDNGKASTKEFLPESWTDERYEVRRTAFDLKSQKLQEKISKFLTS